MQFITPIILIAISAGTFFFYTYPAYKSVSSMDTDQGALNQAIDNAVRYRTVQDNLASNYRNIKQDDINKMRLMLPDNIDNVRLVIDLEKIANDSGLAFKSVQYDASATKDTKSSKPVSPHGATVPTASVNGSSDGTPYGSANISFTVTGPYEQFIVFLKKLEQSLRLIDVTSVGFSVAEVSTDSKKKSDVPAYDYTVTIKTYWLKN